MGGTSFGFESLSAAPGKNLRIILIKGEHSDKELWTLSTNWPNTLEAEPLLSSPPRPRSPTIIFFRLCEQAKGLLAEVREGDIVMFQSKSKEKFLSFLMATLERKAHFLPVYEYATKWEKDTVRRQIKPHWEVLDNGLVRPLYCEHERLSLPSGVIFQTSGTSGSSRFVYQSQSSLIDNAHRAKRHQNISEQSRVLVPLTLCHTGGLNMQTLPAFLARGTVFFPKKMSASIFEKFFDEEFTHALLVPLHLRSLMNRSRWRNWKARGRPTILTGSCPVSDAFYKDAEEKNMHLLGVYGLTEVGPFVAATLGSGGDGGNVFPLGQSDEAFELKLNSEGEILIKGPCVGTYLSRTQEGAWHMANCGDPWVATGDRGEKKDGVFYYLGRIKREINFAGVKINPEEIEEVLKRHPQVQDCFVFGKHNILWHEIPYVKIMARGVSLEELKIFLREHISSRKIPHKWIFVDHLDRRTSIGKLKMSS